MWPGNRHTLSTYERRKKKKEQYFLILHKYFEDILSAVLQLQLLTVQHLLPCYVKNTY